MGASLSTIFLRLHRRVDRVDVLRHRRGLRRAQPVRLHDQARPVGGFGKFLIMGLVGLIVAMLINVFLPSAAGSLIISVVGVLLFAGLTVYDTQKIKQMYGYVAGTDMSRQVDRSWAR